MMSYAQRTKLWVRLAAMFFGCVLVFGSLFSFVQATSPPNMISYQGRLLDVNGVPVTASSASMIFEMYTAASGGTCVWSNSDINCATATARTVTLTSGLFSENLGDTSLATPYAAIGEDAFADNTEIFLKVTVNGEALSPRKQITSVLFALNAQTLDGLDSLNFLQKVDNLSGLGNVVTARSNLGLGSAALLNDVTLGTDTAGSYVASVGTSVLTGLTGGASGSEGAALTLAFDYSQALSGDIGLSANAAVFGASGLVFEGSSADTIETYFSITNPTSSDKTITFQNASGTVAFTGDIPAGAGLWEVGTNGTYEDDAAMIAGADAAFSYVGTPAAGDLRVADDFEAFGDGYFGGNLVAGASTSATETITNPSFSLGGDDLFAADDVGIEGDLYLDGNIEASGGTITAKNAAGDGLVNAKTSVTTSYSALQVFANVGASTKIWDMYLANATAAITNGSAPDLRWTPGGSYGADDEMRLTTAGELFLDTGVGVGAADVAEVYTVADFSLSAGDLVGLATNGSLVRASSASRLFGVVSTAPGVTLNNGENDTITSNERPVVLIGRAPVRVNLDNGTIMAGDPLTSSTTLGVAMKAIGPGMILGFALESYDGTGDNLIDMFVNVQWHSADRISADGSMVTMEGDVRLNSGDLVLRGTLDSDPSITRDFSIGNIVTSSDDYRLSIRNAVDAEIAYLTDDGAFSMTGDMIVGGHLYPSDRGVAQTNRYIFYDGSSGPGGDFMRTNASGWATGSYDFAEMFQSTDTLEPGDLVVFGSSKEQVVRSNEKQSMRLAGIVSTRPGFLTGENTRGSYPIALAGRVPTKVNNEGGAIVIGDALTSSSTPGVAMKATESGMIVGYALEEFSGTSGVISVFVRPEYWAGTPSAKNTASGLGASFGGLDLSGNFYVGANDILNVGSIVGMGDRWSIDEDGNIRTEGLLATTVMSYQNEKKDTFATTSPEVYITLAGTVELANGRAHVSFEQLDPSFNDVISNQVPVRVTATPLAPISVYIDHKDANGFDIVALGGTADGVSVDWYAVGYRKDVEPGRYLKLPDQIVETPKQEEDQAPVEQETSSSEEQIPTEIEPAVEVVEPTSEVQIVEPTPEIETAPVESVEVTPTPSSDSEIETQPAPEVSSSTPTDQIPAEPADSTSTPSADVTE